MRIGTYNTVDRTETSSEEGFVSKDMMDGMEAFLVIFFLELVVICCSQEDLVWVLSCLGIVVFSVRETPF